MTRYVLRRLLWTVFTVVVIVAATFIMFRVLPSADPAALRAGKSPTPERLAIIRETLGLDRPLFTQFWEYLKGVAFHADFGRSYATDAELRPILLDSIGSTLWLSIGAAIIWLGAGVTVGIISAVRRGTVLDRTAMGGALLSISAPVYWLGLVALLLLGSDFGVVKIFPGYGAFNDASSIPEKIWALVLPCTVLATAFSAIYARLMRSTLLETMSQDYIRTARAKGLSERRVIWRHGVRAAVNPLVTALGIDLGLLIGGNAILTESVFGINGIGRFTFLSISRGDIASVQGCVLFLALFVSLSALIVDLVYAWIDPRVKYA